MARITWADKNIGEKAQFIADTLNECLFDYSFDSNKVPSLNLHFFCKDYIATYLLVKEGIMQDGNMIPLNEELEHIIQSSPWLPTGISNDLFFFKNSQGRFFNVSTDKNVSQEKKTDYYYSIVNHINDSLNTNNMYCTLLIEHIAKIIDSSPFLIDDKRQLLFCTREFICELINLGFSKQHLYNRVQNDLFTNKLVEDGRKYIIDFLNSVVPVKKDYNVIFGIGDEIYNELKDVLKNIRESSKKEHKKISSNYVAEAKIKAADPVSALYYAKESFTSVINIYNAALHSSELTVMDKGLVRLENAKYFSLINDKHNLLKKAPVKRKAERDQFLHIVAQGGLSANLLTAFELHNNAINMSDAQSQLLSLWTIIELLIETKQNLMNRVNYVSNILVSILDNQYFKQLLNAIYLQIKSIDGIQTTIDLESRGKSSLEKLSFILKDNNDLIQQLKKYLEDFPLTTYKIDYYSALLSDPNKIREDFIRHSNRLKWQIMRIYRNRCMIVHDGSSMPYLEFITENLHYYIDEIIDSIIACMRSGYKKNEMAFSNARLIEAKNQNILATANTEKRPLTDDEFCQIIFS